jgi:hypothetical protein
VLRDEPLSEWMLRDERVELRYERRMTPDAEISLDPLLDPGEAELIEPRDCALGERLVGEVGQRRASPLGERFAKQLAGLVGIAPGQLVPRVLEQLALRLCVELPRLDAQHVPVAARLDRDLRKCAP